MDSENSERIAVCNSIFKQKAPTLHWEPALNFSSNISSVQKHGRFFMMENRVYLPDNITISELICVATYTSESGSVQHRSTLHTGEHNVFEKELRIDFKTGPVVNYVFINLSQVRWNHWSKDINFLQSCLTRHKFRV